MHSVSVVLHPEVTVRITLNVARSPEEAELQASGKSIRGLAAEAEAAAEKLQRVRTEVAKSVFGQERVVELALAAVLAAA